MTDMPVSSNGTDNAINGAVMPSSVADFWLHTAAKHPSRKPIVRLPQSPRKIDAGLKLYRRNASSAPTSGAVASASAALLCSSAAASVVNEANKPMPVARPSIPSMRLNALEQATSQTTVIGKLHQPCAANPATPDTLTPAM